MDAGFAVGFVMTHTRAFALAGRGGRPSRTPTTLGRANIIERCHAATQADEVRGTCDGFAAFSSSTSSSSGFSISKTLVGAAVGTGIERLLGTNVTLRVEYIAAIYGTVNFGNAAINSFYTDSTIGTPPGSFCNCTVNSTTYGNVSAYIATQTVRFAITTKFP
jgi:opacity protein-like surface antigen